MFTQQQPSITVLFLTLILSLITACSSASSSFNRKASQAGFKTSTLQGLNYQHTVYSNAIPVQQQKVLHVYLGGDGTPWFEGRYITEDPTPLKPIMLDLMKIDSNAALYLGRPCYHQNNMPNNCHPSLWTSKRYSATVVNSMVTALKTHLKQHAIRKVKLFGFSGGGALAMLIAPKIKQVSTIITLAGNLDTDAWTGYHGYRALSGSLNPAKQPRLPIAIRQYHYLGGKDKNIRPQMIKSAIKRQSNAKLIILKDADHHCCWVDHWKEILATTQ